MSEGFGLISSVLSPLLEKVAREERLGREHPQKNRDGKPNRAREVAHRAESPTASTEDTNSSMSSTHIDLRI